MLRAYLSLIPCAKIFIFTIMVKHTWCHRNCSWWVYQNCCDLPQNRCFHTESYDKFIVCHLDLIQLCDFLSYFIKICMKARNPGITLITSTIDFCQQRNQLFELSQLCDDLISNQEHGHNAECNGKALQRCLPQRSGQRGNCSVLSIRPETTQSQILACASALFNGWTRNPFWTDLFQYL